MLSDEEFWQSQRRYKRAKVVWPATLIADSGQFDCIVLDLSANGARVRIGEGMPALSGDITLEISRFGAFRGEAAWQTETEIGLRFAEDPTIVADVLGETLPALRDIAKPAACG
jgi:hypothetical protein